MRIEIGQLFNGIEIISEIENYTADSGVIKRAFICKCVCGEEKRFLLDTLRAGLKSCGCLNKVENRSKEEDYHLRK